MLKLDKPAEGFILNVKVQPGARRSGTVGIHDGKLKIQVTEAPEKGKATEAVIALLAEILEIKRSQITLISGATSPIKRFLIRGLTEEQISDRTK